MLHIEKEGAVGKGGQKGADELGDCEKGNMAASRRMLKRKKKWE